MSTIYICSEYGQNSNLCMLVIFPIVLILTDLQTVIMNSFSHHVEFEYYATNKREGTTQQSWRAVSYEENYDNVVGVLCCYKGRPGPWWNNPMLDNLLVTPVIFIKTGPGSLN